MPARSQAQQMAAGVALAAKRGEIPKRKLRGASKEMFETMTIEQLEDLADTPRENLPYHKEED